jgi:predicted extracellular nuclease
MRVLLTALAATLALAAPASAASPDLVVSQVYGGGGNSGAPFNTDFVEIFNRGAADVPLGGKSLQYASATGTGNFGSSTTQLTELPDVTLGAGQYFLVAEAGGTTGASLPDPDLTDPTPIALAAGAGKVALVTGTTTLGCNGGSAACDAAAQARIIDFVGYGTANFFEGLAAAPAASNSTSVSRLDGGCQDTDQNATDFLAGAPAPRDTGSARNRCDAPPADQAPSVSETSPANGATQVPLDASVSITFTEDVALAGDSVSIGCTDSGAHAATGSGGPRTFTFDPTTDFVRNETCTVTVSAAGVSDQDADDPPDAMAADYTFSFSTLGLALRIHDIQGAHHLSPYDGDFVAGVPGVVTARASNGFWFQDTQPDGDERTSEGVFVFTGSRPAVGQAVEVNGQVDEFRPGAEEDDNLTITELTDATWVVAGTGAVQPTTLGLAGRLPPVFVIDNDSVGGNAENPATPFDPRQDGLDFHESLEGMLVKINNPVAVGPTNGFGELPAVGDCGLLAFPRTARGGVLVRPWDFNPERLILDDGAGFPTPTADVRDRVDTVQAVVHYSFGNFKYNVTSTPAVQDGGLEREVTEAPRKQELAVASMNVENLDPGDPQAKFDELAQILVDNMQAPDLVAVEEVQDNDGPTDTGTTNADLTYQRFIAAIAGNGGPAYDFRQIDPVDKQDGGEPGGNIRVGFLFRTDRGLSFVDRPGGTATTPTQVVDGPALSVSPGRIDPTNPAFNNSRKPLAGEFRWEGRTLFVIANHLNSKGGDDPLFGRVQPPVRSSEVQRHAQANVVAGFVEQLLAAERRANVVVLGDLNDFEFSETLDILEGAGLTNLMETLPVWERYSYVFDGNSQTLDQILVSGSLTRPRPEYDSVHVNAEFADQASDHDPQVARLQVTGRMGGN